MTSTRLLCQSQGAILVRIPLIGVPGLFSLLSSGVHGVTIQFQNISAINVFVSEVTGGGDPVECSWLITNLLPYNDGTSLPNESSVSLSTMEYNDKYEGVEGELFNSKAVPY